MAKRKNPHLAAWQAGARERLRLVLERKYHGLQSPLANALGVSHTLVSLVLRSVQPPTRNLMARLGSIAGVNPRWADTGEGEPFVADAGGTLPISDVLLSGPPTEHVSLMTGERFAAPSIFDRPSCYYFRLPSGHSALAVEGWRLSPNDLLLLETAGAVVHRTDAIVDKKIVIDGRCLGRTEPVYGTTTRDEKSRLVFGDDKPQLRFDPDPRTYALSLSPPPLVVKDAEKRKKKTVRNPETEERKAAEKAADPWYALPRFDERDVLAVQLLMIRF